MTSTLPPLPGLNHPCQFSRQVLDVIRHYLTPSDFIYDPFAGPGTRLAALCDEIGATFSGGDIEDWPGKDPRVTVSNALDPLTYPPLPFVVVTSPVYVNKRCGDYANGPTPTTNIKGRRDYGISLGRALHPDNLARVTGRPSKVDSYWHLHSSAAEHWGDKAIVNVDLPISDRWQALLEDLDYQIDGVLPAFTKRYGGLDNAEKRAAYEVVIVASK